MNKEAFKANVAPGEIVQMAGSHGRPSDWEYDETWTNVPEQDWDWNGTEWAQGQKYRTIVWDYCQSLHPKKILEIGPYGLPFFKQCDTIDNQIWFDFQPTWLMDVTIDPIPVSDNTYDLCIASEVFEHLWPHQKKVFDECLRVAKVLVIAVPYKWSAPLDNDGHDDIDEQTVRGWFGRYPDKWELVSDAAYGKFKDEDATRRWHRMVAVYHQQPLLKDNRRWNWRNGQY